MRLSSGVTAVVTGAASGIGRALAKELSLRGCDLALVDVDEVELSETAESVRSPDRRVSTHVADVASPVVMEQLPSMVLEEHDGVHLLVNNAGVSLSGPFEAYELDDFRWVVETNFWGVVHGCRFFLPYLRQQTQAHIVNISSGLGLLGFPTKTAYSASKFAIRGFSEALRAELYGTTVGVTAVYPGPVDTALIRDARAVDARKKELEAEFVARRGQAAERVAKRILSGVERGASRVLIGLDARLIDLTTRLFPTLANSLVGRFRSRFPFA